MSSDALVKTEPALLRMLRALGLAGVREDTNEPDHVAGADFANGLPAHRGFAAIDSLATVAVFPIVNAAMNAIASDLSALPLKVSVGKGADARLVDNHPILELLERPSSRVSGVSMRRQLATDLFLTGDAYLSIHGSSAPEFLLRLHPARVKIYPRPDGQVSHFEYSGAGTSKRYEWDQVAHFHLTSWEDDPKGMYGNGAIRALATDLQTDKFAAELAANSARQGRPTTVFSPSGDDTWSKSQIDLLRSAYERQMKGSGGALFLGGAATMESISYSPRDLEYSKVREGVRENVLAVFDCPPTRLGGSSVNYATAAEQSKHWWSGLRSKSEILNQEFSKIARLFPGWENSDVRVSHDFSGVDALAESRDARVGRVMSWSALGLNLNDAAAFEGFDDLPGNEPDEGAEAPVDGAAPVSDQPMAATALNGAQVSSLISILGQVSGGLLSTDAAVALIGAAFPTVSESQARRIVEGANTPPPAPEPVAATKSASFLTRTASPMDRALAWDHFIKSAHEPSERAFETALSKYLRSAAARTALRLKKELKKNASPFVPRAGEEVAIDESVLAKVLDELHEAELLRRAVAEPMRAAFSEAALAAVKTIPDEWATALAPIRTDPAAVARIGQLVKDVQPYTADAVRDVMAKGLTEGATTAEMQTSLMNSRGYSPARALRISTTEATTAVNAGTLQAYQTIADAGFPLKYEWLSAKDRVVRDEHRTLDAHKPIAPGEKFKVGDHEAAAPGQFGSASMNVNCRCALLPVIDED